MAKFYVFESREDTELIPALLNEIECLQNALKAKTAHANDMQQQRDHWKLRCDALESAVTLDCSTCLYNTRGGDEKCVGCGVIWNRVNKPNTARSNWKFDVARFAVKEDNDA